MRVLSLRIVFVATTLFILSAPALALAQSDDDGIDLSWRDGYPFGAAGAVYFMYQRATRFLKENKVTFASESIAEIESKLKTAHQRIERLETQAEQYAELEAIKARAQAEQERLLQQQAEQATKIEELAEALEDAHDKLDEYQRMQEFERLLEEAKTKDKDDDDRDGEA
jgi:predicted transcriptional regulator